MWLAVAGARWASAGGTYFVPDRQGRVTIGGPAPASAVVDTRLESGEGPDVLAPLAPTVRAELAASGARAVLVGPMAHAEQVVAWWTATLGRPPRLIGGVDVWNLPDR